MRISMGARKKRWPRRLRRPRFGMVRSISKRESALSAEQLGRTSLPTSLLEHLANGSCKGYGENFRKHRWRMECRYICRMYAGAPDVTLPCRMLRIYTVSECCGEEGQLSHPGF